MQHSGHMGQNELMIEMYSKSLVIMQEAVLVVHINNIG